MDVLLWTGAVVLVVAGIAGIVLPALPGTALIFAGLLLGAWADGFMRVGWPTLLVIGLIGVATYFVDFVAAGLGTKRFGASSRATVGAGLGTVLGLFVGLPGIIIGPFVGAVLGELTVHRDYVRAGKVGVAAWIGFVVGMAVKVALAFAMIGIFAASMLF
jgi:uncharacterized protein YqgC (DUF456 family)